MLPLPSGQRERIGNRVRIPDGTAAVCAEAACRAKAGHWGTLRRRARPSRRESEDLLGEALPAWCGKRGALLCANADAATIVAVFFFSGGRAMRRKTIWGRVCTAVLILSLLAGAVAVVFTGGRVRPPDPLPEQAQVLQPDRQERGGSGGVRPLCNLSSGILVSDSPDSDGAYTIIWNRAPSKPSSITVPSSVRGGESLSISWGASTDEDGNLSGYILERQVNGGAWAQVYKGINRSYTDAITFGWTSVAYRVKAYDSAGAESAYQTSATRTVVNNHAPVISGTDSNLGTKTAAFAQSYSVTDEDSGQTLTVTEYIDGTQKRSYTATSGQTYSFNITAAEWVKLLNGSHTLKIVAADNYGGSATRTYTFAKNETEIELTLATPLTADDMVTKGIMSVVRQIPAGAKFTVEVCNNGNDTSPTWEDVTQNVVSGSKFFLSNTTKTASAWGYNFRIKVKRGTATGDCFITSAGGNFE